MKNIALLFLSLLFINCGSKKSTTTYYNENTYEEKANYVTYDPLSEEDKKYFSKKLEVSQDEIINGKLYKFIKEWEGTKYVYGGETKQGIDCSALMQRLFKEVYNCELPRTAEEMGLDKRFHLFKLTKNLKEGDLVFFRITEERIISHVGIYLKNNKFFNANLSGGASISDLKSEYWKKFYVVSGRLKNEKTNE
ncbi:Lipoprotein Spr [Flavobacterium sp. 9AF]|uniref:C40 family peptidase n=1 Tax=Flavobacterium sp. 9AF TaxID=2653142 RepID=UPI0012F46BD4|nr:C40 family peptidase [Flavobacterium sp. 9AF]VXB92901.1 Lipoprotein Spr [Flavobacterium sp. 9AF]